VACHNAYQRGEHAPNWKGGKSYWRDPDWPQTRKAILERDAYTCQCCGKQAGNRLHVHHIVPWLETFDNSPENLLTYCLSCHRMIEPRWIRGEPGTPYNTPVIYTAQRARLLEWRLILDVSTLHYAVAS
jgi:5-methylcytosine-specific restriction endonuclease McrA